MANKNIFVGIPLKSQLERMFQFFMEKLIFSEKPSDKTIYGQELSRLIFRVSHG